MPVLNNSHIPTTSVAGVRITNLSRTDLRVLVQDRLHAHMPTRIVTPYSEFLFEALHNPVFKELLNTAEIALPDGIATAWAATFLEAPLSATNTPLAWAQVTWQMVRTGAAILLRPATIRRIIPETIQGSEFVYDLCEIAAAEKASVFIAGGFGDVPSRAAQLLQTRYPGLHIAGTSNASVQNIESKEAQRLVAEIHDSGARVLFLALGPQKQEQFMMHYWEQLGVELAIGLGGTFNYIVGAVRVPPRWLRRLGLEWLFRLITQPSRAPRIGRATFGLVQALMQYKIQTWRNTQ